MILEELIEKIDLINFNFDFNFNFNSSQIIDHVSRFFYHFELALSSLAFAPLALAH